MPTPSLIIPSAPVYDEGNLYGLNVYGTQFAPEAIPFTRATTATRTNAAGLVELVPYNLVQYSEMFSQAIWVKSTGVPETSILPNTILAPNGTLTADTFYSLNTGLGIRFIVQSVTKVANPTNYTYTVYLKAKEITFATFSCDDSSGNGFSGGINLLTGQTIGATVGTGGVFISVSSESVGNGWYKCTLVGTSNSSTTVRIAVNMASSLTTGYPSLNANSNDGLYIWGAQLVEGTAALPYLKTETRLNRPRVDFSLGGCPNLLLEPQRTNLALQSSSFDNAYWIKTATVTSNTTTAPDGTLTADTFTDNSTSYQEVRTPSITIIANGTYTASVFIKKTTGALTYYPGIGILLSSVSTKTDFGILNTTTGQIVRDASSNINSATYSTQSVGDYWRVIVTFTDNQSNLNCGVYLYPAISSNGTSISPTAQGSNVFWGAQLEAGAYETSYIPTLATSVTRNADSFTESNVFSRGMITAAGGTWFVELRNNRALISDAVSQGIYLETGTGWSNGFSIRGVGGISGRVRIYKNLTPSFTPIYVTTTDTCKLAIKWNGATADVFENGVKVVAATAFNITNMQNLGTPTFDIPAYINQMALYPTPLSDSELISMTTL